MSEAVFIDLGEEWSVVEERRARRSRERQRPARRAALAALLLVVVLLLAGASAVTTSPFTPLAGIDAPGVSATELGGGVFVAAGTGADLFVARYVLDTGTMTWKTAVPDRAEALAYLAGAGVLTVWFPAQPGANRVTVLDAATGARLWELSGDLYAPPTSDATQALTVTGDPNATRQARYIDLRTGRAIWTRSVPAQAQIVSADARMPSDAAGFMVVAAADGTVTLLARDTGAVLGSLKVDRLVPEDAATLYQPDIARVSVIGGRLLVTRRIGTANGEVASYDLPGLTLRWVRGGLLVDHPSPCGPNLCLSNGTGATTALDPATGASRWTNERWQVVDDLGGGRILAFPSTGNSDHAGILDSMTGQMLGDLGNWTVLAGIDIHLATRPGDNVRSTWIGVVDPGRAVVRPVGKLDGLSTRGCISRADMLVCRTLDSKVRVWRYHTDQ